MNLLRSASVSICTAFFVLVVGTGIAAAGNTAFSGDDWTSRWQYDWTCWDVSIPNSASSMDMTTNGGTGDVDLKMFKGWGHTWTEAGHYCLSETFTNSEDCSAATQLEYDASLTNRKFTYCVKGFNATNAGVAVNAGYTTATGGSSATGNVNPTNYCIAHYRDLLLWPSIYHQAFCVIDWNGSSGRVRADRDFDGFSDQNYCVNGEDYITGPLAREGEYVSAVCFTSSHNTATTKAENCGKWTNLMHGHVELNKMNYLRRPPAVSYNLLTDNNSDCWAKDFSQCMGISINTLAPFCVDETHPAY